jgi:hypothetical protein
VSSRQAEVNFGEGLERRVLNAWLGLTRRKPSVVFHSGKYHDFDFGMLDDRGFPMAWVEVKVRRRPLAEYGDAMCPMRKHEFAKTLFTDHGVPCYLVTQYSCGTIVEVDLLQRPASTKPIRRRDRPNSDPVRHAFYKGDQLTVYTEGADARRNR